MQRCEDLRPVRADLPVTRIERGGKELHLLLGGCGNVQCDITVADLTQTFQNPLNNIKMLISKQVRVSWLEYKILQVTCSASGQPSFLQVDLKANRKQH